MSSVVYQPAVPITLVSAEQQVPNTPQRVLLCGQSMSTGSATNGQWIQNIGNANEEIALFGRESMLAAMVRAFKRIAPGVALDVLAMRDNGAGVKRVVGVALGGTATAAGTLTFRVASERHTFAVPVAVGDSAATVAATCAAAMNADLDLPFAVTVVSTTVTFTAEQAGTVANQLGIEVSGSAEGLTVAAVTQSVAGSADPVVTNILDAIGTTRYQGVVWGWPDATEEITEVLDARWNVAEQVVDGVAFTAKADTVANLITLLQTADKNSLALVVFCDEMQDESGYEGPACLDEPYVKATEFAAVRAARLTLDTPISRFNVTTRALDQYGGPHTASLPYFNCRLPNLYVPRAGRGFTSLEIEQIKAAGGAIIGQDPAASGVIAGEVVTTYLTNGAGSPDNTWHYLEVVDTASQVREYFQSNLRATFAQSRLTEGAVIAGHDMANEQVIRGVMKRLYNDLSSVGFVLLQAGEQAITYFEDNLTITLDLALGKATITAKLPLVTQLRTIQITFQIAFSAVA